MNALCNIFPSLTQGKLMMLIDIFNPPPKRPFQPRKIPD